MRSSIVLMLFAFVLVACGPRQKVPDPGPLPGDQTFAGVWFSPQFEHMYLRQQGDKVHGIYTYEKGGTLEGTANGNVLTFVWIDPGDKNEARRKLQGKGYFQMVKEGEQIWLRGEWGYNEDRFGGGRWDAEYVRKMDAEDPRSLEDWREAQGL